VVGGWAGKDALPRVRRGTFKQRAAKPETKHKRLQGLDQQKERFGRWNPTTCFLSATFVIATPSHIFYLKGKWKEATSNWNTC
jgi:hypothetical protein